MFLKGQLNNRLDETNLITDRDDTNVLNFSKSVNRLNVNLDLKNLTYWSITNKISLNVKKTELVIFKHQRKKFDQ